MAYVALDNDVALSTPPSAAINAGTSRVWCDLTTKTLVQTDDLNTHHGILSRNFSTSSQSPFTAGAYVVNSGLQIPTFGLQAGMLFKWVMGGSKTAAGIATPLVRFFVGTTQSLSDTAIFAITGKAATAAISGGQIIVTLLIQSLGTPGILAGSLGFAWGVLGPGGGLDGTVGFNTPGLAGQFIGISLNAGTSGIWTVSSVLAELVG